MSRDSELKVRWNLDKPIYEAWANYLINQVKRNLEPLVSPLSVDYFLRTSVTPRLKDDDGLVAKAFYRSKGYRDPYSEITDKAGIRFVVLLGRDIAFAEQALQDIKGLELSKDRDYEEEQSKNPIAFDYAAIHYVARPTIDLSIEGVVVPAGTPCEVQIKTLLQHAYSELTHDTIYKPQIQATPEMKRDAAKSMALLEATNDYFEKVYDRVAAVVASLSGVTTALGDFYRSVVGFAAEPSVLEGLLLEGYGDLAEGSYLDAIANLVESKPFLVERVKARVAEDNPLFKQPSIWLVYLDIVNRGHQAMDKWRLTLSELEPLMNDLGESVA